jgi:hypothetical protein
LISGKQAVSLTLSSGTTTIGNSGHLNGTTDALDASGAGVLSVTNKGAIDGDILLTNTGNDIIRNAGSIHGDVGLGGGTNTLDSRGGAVSGTITGGSGADTIRLGNDGETVNGGGLDQIYGGSGADTFAFSHDGATNLATIHGFNVSNDTIELSHSVFTRLAIGATPIFAISNYATSDSDHLFYNTTGGSLWYDSNGSAAGGVAEIANLGPGLKLTASSFTVV